MPRTKTRGARWSVADDSYLESRWGSCGIERIARDLGRTICSIAVRARALGMGPACERLISLRQMERLSGYDRSRIIGVATRLGLRLRRAPRMSEREPKRDDAQHRRIVFTHKQKAKVLACIEQTTHIAKLWTNRAKNTERTSWGTGRKPASCHGCSGTDKPHKANGYCFGCYRSNRKKPKKRK